ncbi:hypothetical protein LCGC14_0375230 [marine sediment metagenome]|uniref:Uncharacterized protein n=1 Tax=marine sediment metagenome TaxID=412755 RepID=A0A0F9VR70_9ZZZZ
MAKPQVIIRREKQYKSPLRNSRFQWKWLYYADLPVAPDCSCGWCAKGRERGLVESINCGTIRGVDSIVTMRQMIRQANCVPIELWI